MLLKPTLDAFRTDGVLGVAWQSNLFLSSFSSAVLFFANHAFFTFFGLHPNLFTAELREDFFSIHFVVYC